MNQAENTLKSAQIDADNQFY